MLQSSTSGYSKIQGSHLKKESRRPERKVSFMTDFSDDSDVEANVVEVNSSKAQDNNHCLIDSASTHVILKDKAFFWTQHVLQRK
jgi:hypothetical protein